VSVETNSIRELVKSWMLSTWAATLFGVSQIARVLGSNDSEWKADSLEAVTRAVESELSKEMRMVFQSGDQLQRGLTASVFSALAGKADISRLTAKTAVDVAQCAAGTAAALLPTGENQIAWQELQNKLQTFNLFAHIDLEFDLAQTNASLSQVVECALRLGPYRSVWAIEGVGHFYAESGDTLGTPINLKAETSTLPPSSLVALHSGAGLSFAGRCLEAITSQRTDAQIRATLERFIVLCEKNSHEAYVGAAYEALGLAARNLHPHLLADIHHHLAEIDEELVAYFWHGVGRAIYFAPTNFLPDGETSRRLVKQVQQEAPNELARLDVLSGLVWALVLVNIRHPKVLESFVRDNVCELNREIFTSALCSAGVIWRDSSPEDKSLSVLWKHQPSDVRVAELWAACVSVPCSKVVNQHYTALRNGGLGRLFRHRSLSELCVGGDGVSGSRAGREWN
jgi:hypothetical protein